MSETETEKSVSVADDEVLSEQATDVAVLSNGETLSAEGFADDEEERLERELADIIPPEETYRLPEGFDVRNDDDSEEGALLVGISGIFDEYGREILSPVFENYLRQSANGIKLAYSKLKNTLLSYQGVTQKYDGDKEKFVFGGKEIIAFFVGKDALEVICVGMKPSKKGVFFRTDALGDKPAFVMPVKKGKKEDGVDIRKAIEVLETLLSEAGAEKKADYAPTAYATRYDFNFEAVVKGEERFSPDDFDFSGEEYDPIEDELKRDIVAELLVEDDDDKRSQKEKLGGLRQQATDVKSAVALTEPVVYFYENALNRDNKSEFLQMKQVLNDKFLGKMLPQQVFAVAENSDRIETLNYFAVKEAVEFCNENPNLSLCLTLSCRLLRKKNSLDKLIKAVSATENDNLVIAFDAIMLEAIGKAGMDGINALREKNVKIIIDGVESVGLHMLTDYAFDYLRFDGRYYKGDNARALSLLDIMVGYAKAQGINTVMNYVDTNKEVKLFLAHDIDIMEGAAIVAPKRSATSAISESRKLPV